MLVLQQPQIKRLVNMNLAFAAVEKAYIAASELRINSPPVGHIAFPHENADCHIKYGHIAGDAFFVIKIATGFPNNNLTNLPSGNGLSLVLSAKTGEVLALLHDEMWLTNIRTGIGGAIASHSLARRGSKRVLIVGTGIQAVQQINSHSARFDGELDYQVWGRSTEHAQEICARTEAENSIQVTSDLATACNWADIIVTTTPVCSPIINAEWVKRGTHITAVGADAPGKQELSSALVEKADLLVADSKSQCIDHGEFANPSLQHLINVQDIVELGQVLTTPKIGRQSGNQITIADLTGIAAQDIAMAGIVLEAHNSEEQ